MDPHRAELDPPLVDPGGLATDPAGLLDPDDLAELARIVGPGGLAADPAELAAYECDAFTLVRAAPTVVALPRSTAETAAVVRWAVQRRLAMVPRGAGTSLAGGATALTGGLCLGFSRMRKILALHPRERWARLEAGVVNLAISHAARPYGLHYAPDPSSQSVCTIGGNVATNAGGPHTLQLGVTAHHVLGATIVTADGDVLQLGGTCDDAPDADLLGLLIGSEGTLGLVTEVIVRLTPLPPAVRTLLVIFHDIADATRAIAAIIAAGIVPAALEMMDQLTLQAVEDWLHLGLPRDAGAVLIIELHGIDAQLPDAFQQDADAPAPGGPTPAAAGTAAATRQPPPAATGEPDTATSQPAAASMPLARSEGGLQPPASSLQPPASSMPLARSEGGLPLARSEGGLPLARSEGGLQPPAATGPVGLDAQVERVAALCRAHGGRSVRIAADEKERAELWRARKMSFGALGRFGLSYCTQDGVVPPSRLPDIVAFIAESARRHGLTIANVMHAGDGNIHPTLLYDERDPRQIRAVIEAGYEILGRCVDLGGTVSGEHGIGLEKVGHLERMLDAPSRRAFERIRRALDPAGRLNPGKVFALGGGCVERLRPAKGIPA